MIPGSIADDLPFGLISSKPLGGGSINQVYFIQTKEGEFCLKYNYSAKYPGMFEAEARGLTLLASTAAIRVPGVVFWKSLKDYDYLLLEYIRPAYVCSSFMSDFGNSLACMHKYSAERFGLDHDNYMGSLTQSNRFHDDWCSFFIEERLRKQLFLARAAGLLTGVHEKKFEALFCRLGALLPVEKPSLLHGDLWSGNFIYAENGRACLIDPAIYYGHREVDVAMTTLFGGFGKEFYNSYDESWPMEPGWAERLEIYNLYPLLVHLNLFGSGYLASITTTLDRFS